MNFELSGELPLPTGVHVSITGNTLHLSPGLRHQAALFPDNYWHVALPAATKGQRFSHLQSQ